MMGDRRPPYHHYPIIPPRVQRTVQVDSGQLGTAVEFNRVFGRLLGCGRLFGTGYTITLAQYEPDAESEDPDEISVEARLGLSRILSYKVLFFIIV